MLAIELQIPLWINLAIHACGILLAVRWLTQPIGTKRERAILAYAAALCVAVYTSITLIQGQGSVTKTNGDKVHWALWAGAIPCNLLMAYVTSKFLQQAPRARKLLLAYTLLSSVCLLFATLSTSTAIATWTGIAVVACVACADQIIFGPTKTKTSSSLQLAVKCGLPVVYALYGVTFVLGQSGLQYIPFVAELWTYVTLDVLSRVIFWTVVFATPSFIKQ
jgi:bacteriorhodopsin